MAITTPAGIVTSLTIDASGELEAVTYPNGSGYVFEYEEGLMTAETDPNGSRFVHEFDASGRVTGAADPEGGAWTFDTSQTGFGSIVSSVLTTEGNLTRFTQSVNGSATVFSATNPAGSTTTRTVTMGGIEVTDELPGRVKRTTRGAWDEAMRLLLPAEGQISMPSGLTRTHSSTRQFRDTDGDGRPDSVTIASTVNGRTSTATVDYLGGTSTHTSLLGRLRASSFDPGTFLVRETSVAALAPVNYEYDSLGRMKRVLHGARELSLSYEGMRSSPSTVVAADGKVVGYSYDAMGRLQESRRPDGSVVKYEYDRKGNLTTLVLPSGVSHSFGRTAFDAARSWDSTPLAAAYSFEYDKERRLTTVTAPSGAVIENLYEYGFHTDTLFPGGHIRFERGR